MASHGITFGILGGRISRGWKSNSAACPVRLCGLMMQLTAYSIAVASLRVSLLANKWLMRFGGTDKETVPAEGGDDVAEERGSQEREPLHFTCHKCNTKFEIDDDNCTIYLFTKQPHFTYIRLECEGCDEIFSLFVNPEQLRVFLQVSPGLITDEWAPEWVVKAFEQLFNLKMPDVHGLTPRQAHRLEFAHWELTHLSDEEIWKELEDAQGD